MPSWLNVDVEGLDVVLNLCGRTATLMPRLMEVTIRDLLKFGTAAVRGKLSPLGQGYWRGALRDSIHGEMLSSMHGQIISDLSMTRAPDGYAEVIEWGRRPGSRPPVRALVPWVRGKLGVAAESAVRVAARIACSIEVVGTTGVGMFERSMPEIQKYASGMQRPVFGWFKQLIGWS